MKISLVKGAFGALAVLLVFVLALQLFKKQAGMFVAGRVIEKQMQRDLLAELPAEGKDVKLLQRF